MVNETLNRLMGVHTRANQIDRTWGNIGREMNWPDKFRAMNLASQEKWGLLITYLSLLAIIPTAPLIFINPPLGATLVATEFSVGTAGLIRNRQAIIEVEQEKLAKK